MSAVTKMDEIWAAGPALTPMDMLNRAVASGASIDILEKLMGLEERWEKNQARKDFDNAVAEAKAKIPPIVKNREGHNGKRYADFAAIAKAIDPIIAPLGLMYRFRSHQDEKTINVACVLSHKSGHSEENTLAGPADTSGSKNAIQAIGSTLSYLQRYTLIQALGLAVSQDDDGAGITGELLSPAQLEELKMLILDAGADIAKFCAYMKVPTLDDVQAKNFNRARDALKAKDKGRTMSDATQGTDAWREQRLGKVTASRISDVIAKTKTGWGASRINYMAELLAERLTGVPAARFTNAAMEWGTANEPEARAAYSFRVNQDVAEVGFIGHPEIPMTGASPDGEIGTDGLVEIKCPNTATHVDTLLGDPIDGKYIAQMQWQMACTGRQWCDWVSYDPRLPETMRLFVKRVPRDNAMIASLEENVTLFLKELATKIRALEERYGEREAA